MYGMNGYIEICNLSKEYAHDKEHEIKESERYDKMKKTLKQIDNVLVDEDVSRFLPTLVVNELKENIMKLILCVDNLGQINADESITDLEKEKKLKSAQSELAKQENKMAKQMDKSFSAFVSSMRLEKTVNKLTDDQLDDYIDKISSEDSLTIEERKSIINEINDIKAEKTSKLEARGDKKTDRDVYEEFDMDVDASKVSISEGKEYRSSVIFASISRRLQQLSVEIAKLESQRDNLSFEQTVELQAKLLEQAELTKELIKLKKRTMHTLKDIRLQKTNEKIDKTINKLNKLDGKAKERARAKSDKLKNKLVELRRKQGIISYDIKKHEIIRLSKKASNIRNSNSKKAFRRVSAENLINRNIKFKIGYITAIPQYIKIKAQTSLKEEAIDSFRM